MANDRKHSGTPTPRKVKRLATQAVALDRTALIGVFGADKDLRAMILLPLGKTQTVSLGDQVIGGTVLAIGPDKLVLARPGGQHVMHMPRG
jgi:hypothetical protein